MSDPSHSYYCPQNRVCCLALGGQHSKGGENPPLPEMTSLQKSDLWVHVAFLLELGPSGQEVKEDGPADAQISGPGKEKQGAMTGDWGGLS